MFDWVMNLRLAYSFNHSIKVWFVLLSVNDEIEVVNLECIEYAFVSSEST